MYSKYLSPLFSRSTTPFNLRDDDKLIQPLKRTTTLGIKSLAYCGTQHWKKIPPWCISALTLNNFKTLMRKWVGPTRGCSMCELVIQIVLYVPKTMCIYVCMHAWACYAQMHERTCACINMKIRIVNYLCMYMYFFISCHFIGIIYIYIFSSYTSCLYAYIYMSVDIHALVYERMCACIYEYIRVVCMITCVWVYFNLVILFISYIL